MFLCLFLCIEGAYSQCDNSLVDKGKEKLKGAKYLKDFKIRLQKGKRGKVPPSMTFSMYFNNGNHYRIVVENSIENEGIGIFSVYDDIKMYGSTYDKEKDASFNVVEFYCTKTQIYYLNIYFKEGKEGCAAIVVGIVEENEE